MTHIFRPPPQPFIGGRQPLDPRKSIAPFTVAAAGDTVYSQFETVVIIYPWDPTLWQQRRKFVVQEGAAATVANADLSSDGAGLGEFSAKSLAAALISSDGSATTTFTAAELSASVLSSDGAATAEFTTSGSGSSALSADGAATATLTTASLSFSAISISGEATVTLEGAGSVPDVPPIYPRPWLSAVIRSWTPEHIILWVNGFHIPQETVAQTAISSDGAATAEFVGSSVSAASNLSSDGAATAEFVGQGLTEKVVFNRQWLKPVIESWHQRLIPLWSTSFQVTEEKVPFSRSWYPAVILSWQKPYPPQQRRRRLIQGAVAVTASADVSSDGAAVATFTGTAQAVGTISSDAAATATLDTKSTAAGTITADGAATATFVGQELQAGRADLSADATSTAELTAATTAAANLSADGSGQAELSTASQAAGSMSSEGESDADFSSITTAGGPPVYLWGARRRGWRKRLEEDDAVIFAMMDELAKKLVDYRAGRITLEELVVRRPTYH